MERDHGGHLRRDLTLITSGIFLASYLVLGLESRKSNCNPKIDWEGKRKDIAVCVNNEGKIIVEGPNTPPRQLPDNVCRTTQVWSFQNENKVVFWGYLDEGYTFQIGQLDLETNEFSDYQTYQIPQFVYYPSQRLPRSAYCLK